MSYDYTNQLKLESHSFNQIPIIWLPHLRDNFPGTMANFIHVKNSFWIPNWDKAGIPAFWMGALMAFLE